MFDRLTLCQPPVRQAGKKKPLDHMRQISFIHTVPLTWYVKINFYININYGKVSFPWRRFGVFLQCPFDSCKTFQSPLKTVSYCTVEISFFYAHLLPMNDHRPQKALGSKSGNAQGKRKRDHISPFGSKRSRTAYTEVEKNYPLHLKKAKSRCLKHVEYRKEVSQWMLVLSYLVGRTFWDLQKKLI